MPTRILARRLSPLAALLALGLAPATRAAPPTPVRAPAATPPARGPRPFLMVAPKGWKVVERPVRVACALEADRLRSPDEFLVDYPLAATPGGPPFATVEDGAVRVLVPAGPVTAPIVVEAGLGGLFLRGYLAPAGQAGRRPGPGEVIVYLGRPLPLGGLYWPDTAAPLRLTRDPRRTFVVAPVADLPAELRPEAGVLPAAVACDALSLEAPPGRLPPPLPAAKPREVQVAGGAALALLDRPGGRRLATIRTGRQGTVLLDVYPEQDGHALVAWRLDRGTVIGYVTRAALAAVERPVPLMGGLMGRPLRLMRGMRAAGRSPDPALTCQDDVLLGVERPAPAGSRRPPERVLVGGFRAGTRIRVDGQVGDTTSVWTGGLPRDLAPAEGVRFFLPNVLLGACRRD